MIETTVDLPKEAPAQSVNGTAAKTGQDHSLTPELLGKMNAYWRAANYLSVGQIYLYDNPLLKEPLKLSHVKPLVVGHWGTTPGPELHLRSSESGHQEVRPRYVLRRRSWSW